MRDLVFILILHLILKAISNCLEEEIRIVYFGVLEGQDLNIFLRDPMQPIKGDY